ncbi:MAG: VanW family protein [Deltaproteobacteria bacterium]|nr:VanW family protein [Deltaproteobacteria bacterium]
MSRPRARITLAVAGLFALDGAILAYAFWPEPAPPPGARPPAVRLAGARVGRETALDLARRYLATEISIEGRDFRLVRTREAFGARVDLPRLERLLAEARDPRSTLVRFHVSAGRSELQLPMPATLDDRAVARVLLQMKQDYDRQPLDARIDPETRAVLSEVWGRRLDLYETLERLGQAMRTGEPRVALAREALAPRLASKDLHGVDVGHVIGFFETRYATDEEHQDRAFNLAVAARKLDGHIVMPGETFSFNAAVGERSEVQGFRTAKVIAQGELVDGLGGGTCQIASTLHAAAFFAGLDVAGRRPHSRPSYYIKMGLDATVVYPNIDLQLRNPFPDPVVLHFIVGRGTARAEILGKARQRTVTFVRHIDEVVPFTERDVEDPTLPRGARVLKQRGIDGYTVRRYRVIRVGALAWREQGIDRYPPTTQIWRVGAASSPLAPAALPADDPHPEYLADEYLWLTQGPDVRGPSGFVEVKRPGRTGLPRGDRATSASRPLASASGAMAR